MLRKGLVGAAVAVLALGSAAFADDSSGAASPAGNKTQVNSNVPADLPQTAINPVYWDDQVPPAPATPAPGTPAPAVTPAPQTLVPEPPPEPAPGAAPQGAIMWGLDQIPGFTQTNQDDLHLSLTGYMEMGYFYDLTNPHPTIGAGGLARSSPSDLILFPGDYKNQIMLNQLDLAFSRAIVDPSKWDVGFMLEGFYGRDAVYTHSNGILDNVNKRAGDSPDDDLDLEQAYLTFNIPIGAGLLITAGKFDTLLGNETINPTTNAFYTHSYIFSYGIPFTQTGLTANYKFCDTLSATAGITRGWNQSVDDNNSAIDFLGQVVWTPNNKLSVTVNLSEGPESIDNDADYWTVPEAVISWQVADQFKVAADILYGDASNIAQWYGVAGYASYTINPYATLNLRAEFYHDGNYALAGASFTTDAPYNTDINYIEGTFGVAITPLPDVKLAQSLTIRPEVRVDTADHPIFDGSQSTQVTFAVDAYWKF
ncbi:MAG TPA: outer membrane beta-barrel protein [Tepidisphaeraceae bacterium]|jgi:hypothetical protein|nr:outer membrane beta-barrel protein [Tepidisphaeraceae bacterium]